MFKQELPNQEKSGDEIWKGTTFWAKEIEKAGLAEKLPHFNDVITETRPPNPESGYHLVLENVTLDNQLCDIYHTDHIDENGKKQGTLHRVFIHKKGQ